MAIGINLNDETDPEFLARQEQKAIRDFDEQCAADEARIEKIAEQYFYQREVEM